MIKRRAGIGVVIGLLSAVLFASVALADTALEDGEYTLTVPGIGDFVFDVTGNGTGVDASMAPEGYEPPDDDDDDKAAWKNVAGIEVEAKTDKVEANNFEWNGGQAILTLPGSVGRITVTEPDGGGAFTVDAEGGWYEFGDGSDWFVANNADINKADKFFKVEATADSVEIKAVAEPNAGFLNDLVEEEEEVEIEAEDPDDEESDD